MRLFIHTGTRAQLTKKHKEGGGYVGTEIMVTDELGVPSGNAHSQWIELCEKKETVPGESPAQLAGVRKISKHVYEF